MNEGHFLGLSLSYSFEILWKVWDPGLPTAFQMSEQTVASGPHQTPFQRAEQTTRYFSSAVDNTPPCSETRSSFSNCVSIENTSEQQSTVQGSACPTLRIG